MRKKKKPDDFNANIRVSPYFRELAEGTKHNKTSNKQNTLRTREKVNEDLLALTNQAMEVLNNLNKLPPKEREETIRDIKRITKYIQETEKDLHLLPTEPTPRIKTFADTPEMAQAEYELIGQHLLKIIDVAQDRHGRLAPVRATTVLGMLGVCAFAYTKIPELIPNLTEAPQALVNAWATGTFVYLMGRTIEVNNSLEQDQQLQTRITHTAEYILDAFQLGRLEPDFITEVDYNNISYHEKTALKEIIDAGNFRHDTPSKAAKAILSFAALTSIGATSINTFNNWKASTDDGKEIYIISKEWMESKWSEFQQNEKQDYVLPQQKVQPNPEP